jgi:hypothetical protein
MKQPWHTLSRFTEGEEIIIERVRIVKTNIAVEGEFELPPLSKLTEQDQMFIAAFIRCHGSIKEMESLFGISYPTVKSRLNRIGKQLDFIEINPPIQKEDVLGRLERGEINVEDAEQALREGL